jgi:hypothetical protein
MIKKSLKNKGKRKLPQMNWVFQQHCKKNQTIRFVAFQKIARGFKHKMNIFDKSSSSWRIKIEKMKLIKFILFP